MPKANSSKPSGKKKKSKKGKTIKSNQLVMKNKGVYYPVSQYRGKGQYVEALPGVVGGAIGEIASPFVRKALGFLGGGAYYPTTSSGPLLASPVPVMHSSDESVRITRTEYLGDIITHSTAGTFKIQTFPINPGIMLYWGKYMAQLFENWKMNGMAFMFKSRSTSYAAATTLGTVIMAVDYNPSDPDFTSKQEMQLTSGFQASSANQDCIIGVEAKSGTLSLNNYFVRLGDLEATEDIHLYDVGKLGVATQGCPTASANLGELYVMYDITYTKPVMPTDDIIESAKYTGASAGAGIDANFFGDSPVAVYDNFIGLSISTNSIHLSPGHTGEYMLVHTWIGTAAAVTAATTTYINGATIAHAVSQTAPVNSVTTRIEYIVFSVTDPTKDFTLSLSNQTGPTAATVISYLFEVNPNLA